ncbi:MAG: sigma-70 family RNA polymerase sigma factor [Planctomycetales bacterium]|nr:sigma-70 family RNA polymerase sigma factor [Planctomycetales bacterium]
MNNSGAGGLTGLVDLTAQRLIRLAVTITRNQHDAEDAVQSVLVRMANGPQRLSSAENPWRYLLQAVRNESLYVLRKRKKAVAIDGLADLLTHCPVDEIAKEESYRAVWSALRNLPVDQSEVVVLKIWEQLTFREIADVLELSASTVASRYRYAMEKLARMLDAESFEVQK